MGDLGDFGRELLRVARLAFGDSGRNEDFPRKVAARHRKNDCWDTTSLLRLSIARVWSLNIEIGFNCCCQFSEGFKYSRRRGSGLQATLPTASKVPPAQNRIVDWFGAGELGWTGSFG